MENVIFKDKAYKPFDFTSRYGDTMHLIFVPRRYSGGELAIQAFEVVPGYPGYFEPYATVTVNLDCYTGKKDQDAERFAFFDTNNAGDDLLEFCLKQEFCRFTGITRQSGYCSYPLMDWDTTKFLG